MSIRSNYESILISELKKCRELQRGRTLHFHSVTLGLDNSVHITSALVSMYSRCGRMQTARQVFERSTHPDVVCWNVLILGHLTNEEHDLAFESFHSMDCTPSHVTFIILLKGYADLATNKTLEKEACLVKGQNLHTRAKDLGLDKDRVLANTLLNMYCKCSDMTRATQTLQEMNNRDVVSWTTLITGYVDNGNPFEALEIFFERMDCPPNSFTLVAALKACKAMSNGSQEHRDLSLRKGVILHELVKLLGCENDMVVSNALVDMYSKLGLMTQAENVFDGMNHRNVITWTSMIFGYLENGQSLLALETFRSMDVQPNRVSFVGALKACGELAVTNKGEKWRCLKNGLSLHEKARELGLARDVMVANTLIDMYFKCGEISRARHVLDIIEKRSVCTWNVLIQRYVENGQMCLALEVFDSMDCLPDVITFVAVLKAYATLVSKNQLEKRVCLQRGGFLHKRARELGFSDDLSFLNTLMDMYTRCGGLTHARQVFDHMYKREVVSWNIIILGYVENGQSALALELFNNMDCTADRLTFIAALKACARLGALESGQRVHDQVSECGLEQDEMLSTCLVDFYGKCGDMDAAEGVFSRKLSQNTVSWTALLAGYASLGKTSRVLALAKCMEESHVRLNDITMLLILKACSHAGLVEEGRRYFESMESEHGIKPGTEHCACMVDMLGRSNKMEEALDFVRGLPFRANNVIWTALLAGCRKWGNVEIGRVAFEALLDLNGDEASVAAACVLMRNIYVNNNSKGDSRL